MSDRSRWRSITGVAMAYVTGTAALLVVCSYEQRLIVLPLLAIIGAGLVIVLGSVTRAGNLPLDDIGIWYAGAVVAYAALPLVSFLAIGLQYTPLNDARLWFRQPTVEEVATIGWYSAIYLATFALSYLPVRGRLKETSKSFEGVSQATVAATATLWLLLNLFFLVLGWIFALQGESYAGDYLAIQSLPLPVRQALKLLQGVELVLTLVVLVWLFTGYARKRYLILLWLAYLLAKRLIGGGQRTEMMLLIAAAALLYHRFVRPVRLWMVAVGGPALLAGFLLIGEYRQSHGLEEPVPIAIGTNMGEFEALFANAIDLRQRKVADELGNVPNGIAIADIVAIIPSQLLPFEKLDPADWYIATYYPSARDAGGGFAFGVIAQTIIGFGWPELIIRGALLGIAFAALHRLYASRGDKLWILVAYLWCTIWAYQSYRASSFYMLSGFIQQMLLTIILVSGGRYLARRALKLHDNRKPQMWPQREMI